jgi:hypothetical protein
MVAALLDAAAICFKGWVCPAIYGPPLLCPTVAVDSAGVGGRWQVGFYSPLWGVRHAHFGEGIFSQQQAELYGVLHVVFIALKLGYHSLTLLVDNMATVFAILKLRSLRGVRGSQLRLRKLFNWLWDRHLTIHVYWCPTALQPADPPSRIDGLTLEQLHSLVRLTSRKWEVLFQNPGAMTFWGSVHL